MQPNREKLLELAIQGGATIENAERVASAWENWVMEAKESWPDPLRLDEPSPKNLGKTEPEIDWSRPQLVNNGLGLVIKTTGEFDDRMFSGTVVEVGTSPHHVGLFATDWSTEVFSYHGEIPQEQPVEQKTTGLTLAEAIASVGNLLITRPNNASYGFDEDGVLRSVTHSVPTDRLLWYLPVLHKDDFTATDWQIIEP